MALVKSGSPLRLSSGTSALRTQTPFANYAPSLLVLSSHAHPEQKVQPPQSSESNWSGPRGFGARHYSDEAPFSLWDNEKQDFRYPTKQETDWICTKYSITGLAFHWPEIFIRTSNPPNPLPLTVGCVATTFLPPAAAFELDNHPDDYLPISVANDYTGSGTVPDPLHLKLRKWTLSPTQLELSTIVDALCIICNPRCVFILYPYIIVELHHDDGRVYGKWSLPRRVAGLSAVYHHDTTEIFQNAYLLGKERLITPNDLAWDDSDYLAKCHQLYPGVKVESALITSQGPYAELTVATSTGALLRDNHGHQRLTTANHGFLNSDEVYHPSHTGRRIGEIDERWEALDIALVKLDPSITFSNQLYFEAKPPKKLLRLSQVVNGNWCCVDGMSTGAVYFQTRGIALLIPPRPVVPSSQHQFEISFHKLLMSRGYGAFGGTGKSGICGAPIVEDEDDSGGVIGFFQLANADWAFSPVLDELIDAGWNVV